MADGDSSAARAPRVAPPVFDAQALQRAETALQGLSSQFQHWLEDDVIRLSGARDAARGSGWADDKLCDLRFAAHDLKGVGATYEYPLITGICSSLCRLLETRDARSAARRIPQLIDAHVDAVRAATRDQIKTTDHPIGRALLDALTAQVDALGIDID